MYYRFHPYFDWLPPGGPYAWPTYPVFGGWPPPNFYYSGMGQYSPFMSGGFGPEMAFPPWARMSPFGSSNTFEEEVGFLINRAEMLREELNQIDNRISELEEAN
ncbi:MAG: DUF5320 domain-containing protein [Thermodesulfobacteriota bacterium]|nr:DUF5320 domain-containing protein [Thermodesulfobacteriota bacterium]